MKAASWASQPRQIRRHRFWEHLATDADVPNDTDNTVTARWKKLGPMNRVATIIKHLSKETGDCRTDPRINKGQAKDVVNVQTSPRLLDFWNEDMAIIDVKGGDRHTLYQLEDGSVWSTGMNKYGQLGLGDTAERNEPCLVPVTGVRTMFAGDGFQCLLQQTLVGDDMCLAPAPGGRRGRRRGQHSSEFDGADQEPPDPPFVGRAPPPAPVALAPQQPGAVRARSSGPAVRRLPGSGVGSLDDEIRCVDQRTQAPVREQWLLALCTGTEFQRTQAPVREQWLLALCTQYSGFQGRRRDALSYSLFHYLVMFMLALNLVPSAVRSHLDHRQMQKFLRTFGDNERQAAVAYGAMFTGIHSGMRQRKAAVSFVSLLVMAVNVVVLLTSSHMTLLDPSSYPFEQFLGESLSQFGHVFPGTAQCRVQPSMMLGAYTDTYGCHFPLSQHYRHMLLAMLIVVGVGLVLSLLTFLIDAAMVFAGPSASLVYTACRDPASSAASPGSGRATSWRRCAWSARRRTWTPSCDPVAAGLRGGPRRGGGGRRGELRLHRGGPRTIGQTGAGPQPRRVQL
ncbi:putative ultraviolet-B receptor UVR8-like isoform X2 [Penaeus vannamei]|uniref:Putative ultraviolet-B receptor UVR8-like isoform X2 n=1 Tax=Penaeus vannamei TaxID=6689 RepID=A0A3R7SZJ3_PENVA|nr:putative ultraviolet-B receptor UVR8-like isoform X2 [Penaeus vannamei]